MDRGDRAHKVQAGKDKVGRDDVDTDIRDIQGHFCRTSKQISEEIRKRKFEKKKGKWVEK